MSRDLPESLHRAMVRLSQGERGAFRPVFDGLWPILLRYCESRGLSVADAEDAAQQALVEVFSRIADLDPQRNGVTWALTLTRYQLLTARKRRLRRREVAVEHLQPLHDSDLGPEERLARLQLRQAVRDGVGQLAPSDRRILEELLAEGNLDRGETARKQRYRAKVRLREWWRRVHGR